MTEMPLPPNPVGNLMHWKCNDNKGLASDTLLSLQPRHSFSKKHYYKTVQTQPKVVQEMKIADVISVGLKVEKLTNNGKLDVPSYSYRTTKKLLTPNTRSSWSIKLLTFYQF